MHLGDVRWTCCSHPNTRGCLIHMVVAGSWNGGDVPIGEFVRGSGQGVGGRGPLG